MLVMSNLYDLNHGSLIMSPKRMFPTTPLIKLGDAHFAKVKDFLSRFANIPDLLELDHLTVSGDVTFGRGVSFKVSMFNPFHLKLKLSHVVTPCLLYISERQDSGDTVITRRAVEALLYPAVLSKTAELHFRFYEYFETERVLKCWIIMQPHILFRLKKKKNIYLYLLKDTWGSSPSKLPSPVFQPHSSKIAPPKLLAPWIKVPFPMDSCISTV